MTAKRILIKQLAALVVVGYSFYGCSSGNDQTGTASTTTTTNTPKKEVEAEEELEESEKKTETGESASEDWKNYNLSPMANQNLTEDEARKVLEYFRTV